MRLEDIGFYTLSDERAANATAISPMQRCELLLTDRCNFKCAYCRGLRPELRGDIPREAAFKIASEWAFDGLKNIRFSGGEPTLWPYLIELVEHARDCEIERIALSTNGSASPQLYRQLVEAGVNDFSISLDGCCAADIEEAGGHLTCGIGNVVLDNLAMLSDMTYVTVGVVLTEQNREKTCGIVSEASRCGVSDIRVIPVAQDGQAVAHVLNLLPTFAMSSYPILQYRSLNAHNNRSVRGISPYDNPRCPLLLDDSVVCGKYHFPCIIHLREGGEPIGRLGVYKEVREARVEWARNHDTFADPICRANCLDVCVDYNNRYRELHKT